MQISDTFDFTAPPEVVYNSLTDPDRAHRWVPTGVRMRWLTGQRVRLEGPLGATEYDVTADTDDLRLTWQGTGTSMVRGTAEVLDGPAGGSQVRVTIDAPEHRATRVRAIIGEIARHLQWDVSDNFNPG